MRTIKKQVYIIKNLVNNKVYIGQTKRTLEVRLKRHESPDYTSLLQKAIKKYGRENFSIESLYSGEDYNERERFYIKEFDSRNPLKGYNICPGGEDPPIWRGDESPFAIYNQAWFEETVRLLTKTNLFQKEIAEIQGCHFSTVSRINLGIIRKDERLVYPLRRTLLSEDAVSELKWFLINTDFHRGELSELYGVGISAIKAIRSGQNHFEEVLSYPLGGSDIRLGLTQHGKIDKVKRDLREKKSIEDICSKYKISFLRLQYINEGRIYFEEDCPYPLNQEIEKPVETIPVIGK